MMRMFLFFLENIQYLPSYPHPSITTTIDHTRKTLRQF